jgi:hypothetical protein
MADLLRHSEAEHVTPLVHRSGAGELSKTRLQPSSQLMWLFGLLLLFGTIFASLQAMEICSTSLKANFCP